MYLSIAWAADAAAPAAPVDWNAILGQILMVVVPTVVTALSILGGIVLNRLRAKLAASEAVDKDALSKSVVKQGVFLAEEQSAARKDRPLAGPDKEAIATAFIQARLPDKPPAAIAEDIKASLGSVKGLGASKDIGDASPRSA